MACRKTGLFGSLWYRMGTFQYATTIQNTYWQKVQFSCKQLQVGAQKTNEQLQKPFSVGIENNFAKVDEDEISRKLFSAPMSDYSGWYIIIHYWLFSALRVFSIVVCIVVFEVLHNRLSLQGKEKNPAVKLLLKTVTK